MLLSFPSNYQFCNGNRQTAPSKRLQKHHTTTAVQAQGLRNAAMEAGANTLAFVILAIKSAKLIHTVLRSIKDGPENVRRTADDVAGLLSTLEQLSRCRALERSGCGPLEARLLRCVDDLEAFDGDIKRLEVGEGEGKRVRYWRRVKAAWGERRLDGMRVVVSGHCAALNLQLSALQRFVICLYQ